MSRRSRQSEVDVAGFIARMGRCVAMAWLLVHVGGCSGGVSRIDPRNPILSDEARHFVASAEDGVVVALAARSMAEDEQRVTERWARGLRERLRLPPAGGVDLDAAFRRLIEARVALAALEVEAAGAEVSAALARRDLAYADQSVRSDLGSYELGPLRAQAEREHANAARLRERLRHDRAALETITTELWTTYGRYVQAGGEVRSFWVAGDPLQIRAAEPADESSGTTDPPSSH